LPADDWLATQQKVLDPLQVLLANGCHLNRRTNVLLLNSTSSSSLPSTTTTSFSSSSSSSTQPSSSLLSPSSLIPLSVIYEDFPSQWPISRQMFAAFQKNK